MTLPAAYHKDGKVFWRGSDNTDGAYLPQEHWQPRLDTCQRIDGRPMGPFYTALMRAIEECESYVEQA